MSVADYLRPDSWYRDQGGPRYMQLRRRIADGVEQGLLPPGSSLPPERDIVDLTGMSRVTVRRAIRELADEGLVVQRHGSGSFIAQSGARVEQSLTRLTSFSEDMARRGMIATSQWLERGLFLPTAAEIEVLGLDADASVSRLSRLRRANGRPMAIERASLPIDLLPNPTIVEVSLYDTLEAAGLRPVRALQRISAEPVNADDARLLDLQPGEAALRIERISYLPDDRVVEFTQSLYRGDAYTFVAELRLDKD